MTYDEAKRYIKDLGFDLNIDLYPEINRYIKELIKENNCKEEIKNYMCKLQNCGGYALQIPVCIFSGDKLNFEQQIIRILELYPFTRLLSNNSEKKPEEDIVIFRSYKNEGKGHHFIRLNNENIMMEKESAELPQVFKDWGRCFNDAPEAVIAVRRQEYRTEEELLLPQCRHDMHLNLNAYYEEDQYGKFISTSIAAKPITLLDKIVESLKNRQNSFKYLSKNIIFKKSNEDPDIILVFCDNEKIGEILYTDEDYIIDINEKEKNKILFNHEPIIRTKKTDEELSL